MSRRRKYRNQSRLWPWISFVVFALIVALLSYSIIKKQSPASVLTSVFTRDLDPNDHNRLTKKELVILVEQQESKIALLESDLEECLDNDGFKKGIITTESSTLNMRSEPSLESDVLLRIPSGSTVSILYYDDRQLMLDGDIGQWCKIKYADQEGWIWGNYVKE